MPQVGMLKRYFAEKGFGFIKPDDGSPDLFAPKRTFIGQEERIAEGQKVSFEAEIEDRSGKPKASTWQIIDGGINVAAPAMASQPQMAAFGGGMPAYGAMPGFPGMPAYGAYGAAAAMPMDPRYMPYGMPQAMPQAMPAYGAAPGLPPGWEMAPDPASGKPYYFNRATGESAWTPPAAAPAAAAQMPAAVAAAPAAAVAPAGALPPGWETASDPSSGKPYYFNRATGETAWTPPGAAP